MRKHPGNSEKPSPASKLAAIRQSAAVCRACPLYREATQTVFGEGPGNARIFLVGEQPRDREDREGRPFVGPAGRLLDRALKDAGINRRQAYVTNAVKHFKFERHGKRRLHKKPSAREIAACHPWLAAELEAIHPLVVVCLGATAAQVLLGRAVRVLRDRGKVFPSSFCEAAMVTVHPSSLLRAPDEAARAENYRLFVRDLRTAERMLAEIKRKSGRDSCQATLAAGPE